MRALRRYEKIEGFEDYFTGSEVMSLSIISYFLSALTGSVVIVLSWGWLFMQFLTQYIGHDTAMPVIFYFTHSIDFGNQLHLLLFGPLGYFQG